MGIYDLPAALGCVFKIKQKPFVYIGHSMGTTMFYVMASARPDVAVKVKAMFSLAPIAFINHMKSPIRLFTPLVRELDVSIIAYIREISESS